MVKDKKPMLFFSAFFRTKKCLLCFCGQKEQVREAGIEVLLAAAILNSVFYNIYHSFTIALE